MVGSIQSAPTIRTITTSILSLIAASTLSAADYTVSGQYVTIPVKQVTADGAHLVRLQVVGDRIIRVQATPEAQLPEKQSLIIVKQTVIIICHIGFRSTKRIITLVAKQEIIG